MVVNTATVARVTNRSVLERKSDVLLVVFEGDSQDICLEAIARRRDVIRSLPDPLGSFPVVCRVASNDMSNSWEWKMIAHHQSAHGKFHCASATTWSTVPFSLSPKENCIYNLRALRRYSALANFLPEGKVPAAAFFPAESNCLR